MNRPGVFDPHALQQWTRRGFRLATEADEAYPLNLRTIDNRPPFVFIQGLLCPGDQRAVAVVGTRRPSPEGLARARRLARELARHGVTVVSGLAAGIDTAAHQSAIAAGGRTIAVLGTGLGRCYPAENRDLQTRIPEHGALVSQFVPDTPPSPQTFPQRNVVTSGMALATCVVEASAESGAKLQAHLARQHGRPVLLLQSLVDSERWARAYADRPGTWVVRTTDDILRLLTPAGG